jgi:hypothetical protein
MCYANAVSFNFMVLPTSKSCAKQLRDDDPRFSTILSASVGGNTW